MHKESMLYCKDPSLTIQSFLDMTLVDNIMKMYANTGLWSEKPLPNLVAITEDVSEMDDFQQAQIKILSAQRSFDALPEPIKVAMDYSPAKLLEFVSNPENEAQMKKLGMLKQADVGTPTPEQPKADIQPTVTSV